MGNVICFGEVLWDNLIDGRRIGGAPMNVCYHLNKLGISSTIISQVGDDHDGVELLQGMRDLNLDITFCSTNLSRRTSVVEVALTPEGIPTYNIVKNVAWDYIESTPEIESYIQNGSALVFGSLATRHEVTRNTLLHLLGLSAYNVFDVNLRYPFYSSDLVISLLEQANLLKLNQEELLIICDWLNLNTNDNFGRVQEIQHRFPDIKEILLTKGSQGAVYFCEGVSLNVDAWPVTVKDTIGSGDAFLAGFLAGKFKGKTIPDTLSMASKLASFVSGSSGACPDYDVNAVIGMDF